MAVGKKIRLNRIFSHPSGRFLSVAVDHFIAYGELKKNREAIARFGQGMKPIEAIARRPW